MASGESSTVVWAAIAANLGLACAKFAGAILSGSSAMLTEGVHSLVDTGNGGLLLLGQRRARQPANERHPFGYGKTLYFYTLIVAVLIFGAGGGISVYEGILNTLHAEPMSTRTLHLLGLSFSNVTLNYAVLLLGVLFEGSAWLTALRGLLAERKNRSLWRTIRESKDPTKFTVLFEDTAALLGLVVAMLGIYLANRLAMPSLDGVASILIGLILCATAAMLIWESRGLLLGESMDPDEREAVRQVILRDPAVTGVVRLMTMHLSPREVLANIEVDFDAAASGEDVEAAIDRIERSLREDFPQLRYIFIETESAVRRRAALKG